MWRGAERTYSVTWIFTTQYLDFAIGKRRQKYILVDPPSFQPETFYTESQSFKRTGIREKITYVVQRRLQERTTTVTRYLDLLWRTSIQLVGTLCCYDHLFTNRKYNSIRTAPRTCDFEVKLGEFLCFKQNTVKAILFLKRKGKRNREAKDSMARSEDANGITKLPATTTLQLLCHEY